MPSAGDQYVVEVKPSHLDWGEYRNPTNREPIEGESYVKIPSDYARRFNIIRGTSYTAYFDNDIGSMRVKAAGNGPCENGIQYAKQFEGIGLGACKAFTPWYQSHGFIPGDSVKVEFISETEVMFSKN